MEWTEVTVTVDSKDIGRAGDIAHMVVPYGLYVEDYSTLEEEVESIAHIDLIEDDLLQKDRTKGIIHLYISPEESPAEAIAFLEERYKEAGIGYTIATAECAMEDWLNNWKQYYKPTPVGERLLILPSWEKEFPTNRKVLKLEPGLAFGTGTHETTKLCLELIEDYLRPQMRILDVGCGSGILSVASLLLGGMEAVGVDIDPVAVKTAIENAERNGVESRFTGMVGNLTDHVTGSYHMILANIVADAIITLADQLEQFQYCDTVVILSGIIVSREQDVLNALAGKYDVIDRREENGWVAMACQPVRHDSMSMLGLDLSLGVSAFLGGY